SRRAATTAAESGISRMAVSPAPDPWDAGADGRYEAPAGGALLSLRYGDPSGPPDHCPNAASLGIRAASRSFATTRPRPWTGIEIVAHWEREAEHDITTRPERRVRPRIAS